MTVPVEIGNPASTPPGRWSNIGLAPRLFVADLLVIATGAGTLLAVALLIAPALFHSHLQHAHLPEVDVQVRAHVDAAFDRALLTSLAVGVGVAALAAAVISWLVARRLAAPVHDVAETVQRLADGHYRATVPDPGLGREFATLAVSINRLAHRLAATEAERRRLTADLAHQLRTPLASVQATVEALTDGVLALDAATFAVLTDQTSRLTRLVADLETVSRAEERQLVLHPEPHPLGPVIERCVDAVRDRYRSRGVRLEVHVDAAVRARIDTDRLTEVLANLLDNALRHTSSGGAVTVTLQGVSHGGPVDAEITVQDTGEGFAPQNVSMLFQRYYRGPGSDATSGSGLGLTIARAIVEAHGGTLTARSDGPGLGSSFTISLPGSG